MGERGFQLGLISKHRGFLYGFSALWILFLHMSFQIPEGLALAPIRFFKGIGNNGVDLFLMLSAMGMYSSMSKNPGILRFYKRRLLRVYLPTCAFALVYYLGVRLFSGEFALKTLLKHFFPPVWWLGASVFWFVAFILTLYLFYPFIFKLQKKAPWAILAAIPAFMAFPSVLYEVFPAWTEFHEIALARIPVFLAGCAAAPYILSNRRVSYWSLPALLILYFALSYGKVWPEARYANMYLAFFMAISLSAIAEWMPRVRALRPLDAVIRFYGAISLEVYLMYTRVENLFLDAHAFAGTDGAEYIIALISGAITTLCAYVLNRACGFLSKKIDRLGANA